MSSAQEVRGIAQASRRRTDSGGGGAERQLDLWRFVATACGTVLVLFAAGIAAYSIHRTSRLQLEFLESTREVQLKLQELHAGIQFDSRRQLLLVGIRDEILLTNASVSLPEAYDYAQYLVTATEKYPSIDPLLFLAIGIVESGFDKNATSHAGARGLYQIWPSTGRLLARALDWEYHDELLYQPARNTEMAALYLDMLLSTYNDEKLVLAEYNGGPINAGYLRAESSKLAAETREYVDRVQAARERLEAKFELGVEVRATDRHRALSRDAKTLTD